MANSITIKQGQSKALTFVLSGNLTADHTRIYISRGSGVSLDKFSTLAGDVGSGFTLFDSTTYSATDDETTFVANKEASETAAYPAGSYSVSVWTNRTTVGFSEGFVRIVKTDDAVIVKAVTL